MADWVAPESGPAEPPRARGDDHGLVDQPLSPAALVPLSPTDPIAMLPSPAAWRPIAMTEAIDRGARLLRRRAASIIPAVAVFVVPYELVSVATLGVSSSDASQSTPWNLATSSSDRPAWVGWLVIALAGLTLSLVTSVVAPVAVADRMGETVGTGELLWRTLRRSPALVVAWVLVHLAELAGSCTGVLWVAAMVLFMVTVPVIALEGLGPIAAMRRSWRLVAGRFWWCLGLALLTALFTILLSYSLSVLPRVLASAFGGWWWVADGALSIVVGIIGLSIVAGATTFAYLDLRVRREGVDLQLEMATAFPDR